MKWMVSGPTTQMEASHRNGELMDCDAGSAKRLEPQRKDKLCASLQRIHSLAQCIAHGAGSGGSASLVAVEELVSVMDGDDALGAFMAMQSLRERLLLVDDANDADKTMKLLVEHRPVGAKAGRFQLLRQLIKAPKDQLEARGAVHSGDEESEEDDAVGSSPHEWYWAGLSADLPKFTTLVKCTIDRTRRSFSSTHEALQCVAEVMKRASTDDLALSDTARNELVGLVEWVVTQAIEWRFDRNDESAPTFIATALIDLLVSTQYLYQGKETAWVACVLQLLEPSRSISVLARALLDDDSRDADASCAESFVSSTSSYPLLQKWIQLCCITTSVALMDEKATAVDGWEQRAEWTALITILPLRSRLLAVLTEQDDTMIDVLLQLLRIANDVKSIRPLSAELVRVLHEQLDPHLLFADLLSVFGDDHLVILDMLMSSETRMLEYASQYLREAAVSWSHTKLKWNSVGRTNAIMAVLIRLRLEMERLVGAGVFPYNPRPLVRRLEVLEDLFEDQ